MKIGILSDTHNHHPNTQAALDTLRARGVTRLVHCGDIASAETVLLFAGWDVTFVFGNMDSLRGPLVDAARLIGAPPPLLSREIEIEGRRIGVVHGNDQSLLYRMMIGGRLDYLCHGHTHQRRNELRSAYGVRLINPGALGGSQPQSRSVAVLDVLSGELEFIEFQDMG